MKELILLRHLPTNYNNLGRIMGDCIDAPIVNPSADCFNDDTLKYLSKCEVVYTSPTRRSQETARLLFDCPVITDERIRPRGIGDWAGYTMAQIKEVCPDAVITKGGRLYYNLTVAPPNTESIEEVHNRIVGFLDDVLVSPYRTLGIVVHSMLGFVLFALSRNTPIETATVDYSIDFYKAYSISLSQKLLDDIRNRIQ